MTRPLAIQRKWTKKKPIIAVDFDGTIMQHTHPYPDEGPEVPGAIWWLNRFTELDASLILWTVRSDDPERGTMNLTKAVEWCKVRGVEFDTVNVLKGQHNWSSSPKVHADIYIDDAAHGASLLIGAERPYTDWSQTGPDIEPILIERMQFLGYPVPAPMPYC